MFLVCLVFHRNLFYHLLFQYSLNIKCYFKCFSSWLASSLFKKFQIFPLSSFSEKGCIFRKPPDYYALGNSIRFSNIVLTLPEYFHCYLFQCIATFCSAHLKRCYSRDLTSHSDERILCLDTCPICPSP